MHDAGYRNVKVTSCGRDLLCVVQDEREAVQVMCLLLYHGGALNQYSRGNKPCDVEAVSEGLQSKFHCCYSNRTNDIAIAFQTECYFVKRVIKFLSKLLYVFVWENY